MIKKKLSSVYGIQTGNNSTNIRHYEYYAIVDRMGYIVIPHVYETREEAISEWCKSNLFVCNVCLIQEDIVYDCYGNFEEINRRIVMTY